MKISEFRKLIREEVRKVIKHQRRNLREEDDGGKIEKDELHVFDFDDTLGETDNLNGVIYYKDGNPVHKSESEARKWAEDLGAKVDMVKQPGGKAGDAWAVYVMSNNLAPFQNPKTGWPRANSSTTPKPPTSEQDKKVNGENQGSIYLDFTPSGNINQTTTKPIETGIDRLKAANAAGANTMVMTARTGEGSGIDFAGNSVGVTNAKDAETFLTDKGAKLSLGAVGRATGDKGNDIINKWVDDKTSEVHFYDDQSTNTTAVKAAMTKSAKDGAMKKNNVPGYVWGGKGTFEDPANVGLDATINPEVAEAVRVRLQKESRKRSKMKMSELRNIVREEARKFKK